MSATLNPMPAADLAKASLARLDAVGWASNDRTSPSGEKLRSARVARVARVDL